MHIRPKRELRFARLPPYLTNALPWFAKLHILNIYDICQQQIGIFCTRVWILHYPLQYLTILDIINAIITTLDIVLMFTFSALSVLRRFSILALLIQVNACGIYYLMNWNQHHHLLYLNHSIKKASHLFIALFEYFCKSATNLFWFS